MRYKSHDSVASLDCRPEKQPDGHILPAGTFPAV
jgi:hypothetical protein